MNILTRKLNKRNTKCIVNTILRNNDINHRIKQGRFRILESKDWNRIQLIGFNLYSNLSIINIPSYTNEIKTDRQIKDTLSYIKEKIEELKQIKVLDTRAKLQIKYVISNLLKQNELLDQIDLEILLDKSNDILDLAFVFNCLNIMDSKHYKLNLITYVKLINNFRNINSTGTHYLFLHCLDNLKWNNEIANVLWLCYIQHLNLDSQFHYYEVTKQRLTIQPSLGICRLLLNSIISLNKSQHELKINEIIEEIQQFGYANNIHIFNLILRIQRDNRPIEYFWEQLEALISNDIHPNDETFSQLGYIAAYNNNLLKLKELGRLAFKYKIKDNPKLFDFTLRGFLDNRHFQQANDLFLAALDTNFKMDKLIYSSFIVSLVERREFKKALDVINKMEINNLKVSSFIAHQIVIILINSNQLENAIQLVEDFYYKDIIVDKQSIELILKKACELEEWNLNIKLRNLLILQRNPVNSPIMFTCFIKTFINLNEHILLNNLVKQINKFLFTNEAIYYDAKDYFELLEVLCQHDIQSGINTLFPWLKKQFEDIKLFNIMLKHYCQHSNAIAVDKLIQEMEQIGLRLNVDSYKSLLKLYSNKGDIKSIEESYNKLKELNGIQDDDALPFLITAFSNSNQFDKIISFYQQLDIDLKFNEFIIEALVKSYINNGCHIELEELVDKLIKDDIMLNDNTCINLIQHYLNNGDIKQANKVYNEIEKDGRISQDIIHIYIKYYLNRNNIIQAQKLFNKMDQLNLIPNFETIEIFINYYIKKQDTDKIITYMNQLFQLGIQPTTSLCNQVLSSIQYTDFNTIFDVYDSMLWARVNIDLATVKIMCNVLLYYNKLDELELFLDSLIGFKHLVPNLNYLNELFKENDRLLNYLDGFKNKLN